MINPTDIDYGELQQCMYAYLSANNTLEKFSSNAKYVEVCQRILKREWDVLKHEIAEAS